MIGTSFRLSFRAAPSGLLVSNQFGTQGCATVVAPPWACIGSPPSGLRPFQTYSKAAGGDNRRLPCHGLVKTGRVRTNENSAGIPWPRIRNKNETKTLPQFSGAHGWSIAVSGPQTRVPFAEIPAVLAETAHQGRQWILDLDRDSGCSRESKPGYHRAYWLAEYFGLNATK